VLSTSTIVRIYAQGADAILRLITNLKIVSKTSRLQLTRTPQPVIASLMKELAQAKGTLERQEGRTRRGAPAEPPTCAPHLRVGALRSSLVFY